MRLRAVVIDDEPPRRRLLRTVFNMREYEVFTFPTPVSVRSNSPIVAPVRLEPSVPTSLFRTIGCPI